MQLGPVASITLGVMIYAAMNVLVGRTLRATPSEVTQACMYPVMLALSLVHLWRLRTTGGEAHIPSPSLFFAIAAAGVLWFYGDRLFFDAYYAKGAVLTVATVFMLFPVFTHIFDSLVELAMSALSGRGVAGLLPNRYLILAGVFAALAVWMGAKSEALRTAAEVVVAK